MMDEVEGVLKLVLTVSQLDSGVPTISESICLQSLPWRLMVVSQDSVRNSQGGKGRTVGIFVQCVPDSPGSQNWTAAAHVNVKVQNHHNEDKSLTKAFDHEYSNSSSDWGYSSFMKWKDLTSTEKGFMKEEKIHLEAKVILKKRSETETCVQPVMEMGGVGNFLSCPECKECFETKGEKGPLSLRCGHTFCSVCLQKACNKNDNKVSLKCFTCSQLHTSETGNRTELWCPNHSMVQIIGNMVSKSKFFCSIHQHDMNYYCFDDHTIVCIYCAYHGNHSSHNCKPIEEARKEAESSLRKVKLSVSSHISGMERKLQFVKDERKMLASQEASIHQVIEDSYEQLKAVLLKQMELLFQELEDRTAELNSGIDTSVMKLDEQYSKVKAVLSEYSSWKSLPSKDALENYSEIQSRLSSIPSLCGGIDIALDCECGPKLSFEMSGLSEMVSFGKLGKIVASKGGLAAVANDGEVQDLHPNKKRMRLSDLHT